MSANYNKETKQLLQPFCTHAIQEMMDMVMQSGTAIDLPHICTISRYVIKGFDSTPDEYAIAFKISKHEGTSCARTTGETH